MKNKEYSIDKTMHEDSEGINALFKKQYQIGERHGKAHMASLLLSEPVINRDKVEQIIINELSYEEFRAMKDAIEAMDQILGGTKE